MIKIKWAVLTVLIISFYGCSTIDPWTKDQIAIQGAVFVLKATDYYQTKNCISDGGYELNPLMAEDGSNLDITFLSFFILEPLIAHYLPSKWRNYWLGFWTGQAGACVLFNFENN